MVKVKGTSFQIYLRPGNDLNIVKMLPCPQDHKNLKCEVQFNL